VKRAAVGLAILGAILLGSLDCAHTSGTPTPPATDAGIVNCSEAALHAAALDILPAVENALASPTYAAALLVVIASVGGPLALAEVECAVAWVANQSAKSALATSDPLEAAKAAHARAWLVDHPVTFTGP